MLKYKGYVGHVELDDEAGSLVGEVIGCRDVITFEGTSVQEVEEAFRDSIDDYLEMCAERGEEPDRPFTGRLTLRLPPDLHRELYSQAQRLGKSLNQLITDRLAATG
jgi:predicted HicB family RNase H-like nuclease